MGKNLLALRGDMVVNYGPYTTFVELPEEIDGFGVYAYTAGCLLAAQINRMIVDKEKLHEVERLVDCLKFCLENLDCIIKET